MKKLLILLGCLCFALAAVLIGSAVFKRTDDANTLDNIDELRDQLKVYQTTEDLSSTADEQQTATDESTDTSHEETVEVESTFEETEAESKAENNTGLTLDFDSMHETNKDICAWIEIDGTKVDYPVLQSSEDDSKYLTTAVDGSYYIGGSLFTESAYNSADFNDPVTIIYGHTMRSGALFGQLQKIYSSESSFEKHNEIKLYLPGEVRKYTVFAAVPYSNMHILDAYDFSNRYWYKNFFKGVFDTRAFGAQFDDEITPEFGDRVIILSTCLNEDRTKRFLVMAINQDDI